MAENKNLKDYDKQLVTFFIVNIVIFLCFVINKNISIDALNQGYKNINLSEGIIAGGAGSIAVFILRGILSTNFKAILVFWRIKNPLPGCRIFTEIGKKDCRIDFDALENEHGELPKDPQEQNVLWYRLSQKHKDEEMVHKSHRDFLFSRDLTALSFLFLIFYSAAAIFVSRDLKSIWYYLMLLVLQYVIFSIVSRNYGVRFACNVLAKESSSLK
ncbi:hypothetical protein [Clostridium magnum]|uniref:Uncharacterized protein n=1 Tax=Clostridium magnum DSM 2767 TaxID=1121326 RepID=A0A161YQR8_9CLOT|nr:hypothetical protein [Clostridium magnum]KZL93242.1 hypothetical protein CLMAG_02650 [Clostridium magnum DSM 2767]SHI19303.1 hypothetical protein SAMN02745944_03080 [Clostridium magnum DSM 2767]